MTAHHQNIDQLRLTYEEAFDELWQQTCLGRFSVAEVTEKLFALKQRFGIGCPSSLIEPLRQQALG
jgi:predicted unusual protein kinase regulating ubiquinone biosynthesis (AarF/ABC1/UbiB family)